MTEIPGDVAAFVSFVAWMGLSDRRCGSIDGEQHEGATGKQVHGPI
jgi:hypothetical protein